MITIEGAGFSEDVFNQFDPVLGNKVVLILFLSEICKLLIIYIGLVCQ